LLEKNENEVKEHIYRRIFHSYDPPLTFYHPKKDRCTFCSLYEQSMKPCDPELENEYQAHKLREKESLQMKDDEMKSSSEKHRVITFDMEATLAIPFSGESIIYYKRKLALYNFTIYDGEANGYSYLYDETNGAKGCNEVATALLMYLKELPDTVEEVTTWSDTCAAQNRNYHLLFMIIYFVNTSSHVRVVNLKYLESGHTYLQCDSMHACIERKKKTRKIFNIGEMRVIIETARNDPRPYKCKIQNYTEVLDFKARSTEFIKNRCKNVNSETISWLKIKWLRVEKGTNLISYKYDYHGPFYQFDFLAVASHGLQPKRGPRRSLPNFCDIEIPRAYRERLSISNKKKKISWN